ncbi:MAG: GH3 auxin-responsive promoter family protein, partial [Bacteroidaceae bacterium]|nr:GH3 auxin-responsive promoter family protein [Bacteroidaceae bacterium]
MALTSIIRPLFSLRRRELDRYQSQAERLQMQVLGRLLQKAEAKEWGREHDFAEGSTYQQFANTSPV